MWGFRTDIPLRKTAAAPFMQWLVMVLVFMASIAVTVQAYSGALLDHWNRSVVGTLTVQIPPGKSTTGKNHSEETLIAAAMDVLKRHASVASAEVVSRDKIYELLEPWLGSGDTVRDLPLPALIDVELRNDADTAELSDALTSAVPTAVIDDHRVWLSRLINLAGGVGGVAPSPDGIDFWRARSHRRFRYAREPCRIRG